MASLYEPFPTGYEQGMWKAPAQSATAGAGGGALSGLGLPKVGHPLQGLGNMVQALMGGYQKYQQNQQNTPKAMSATGTQDLAPQPEITQPTPLPPPPDLPASKNPVPNVTAPPPPTPSVSPAAPSPSWLPQSFGGMPMDAMVMPGANVKNHPNLFGMDLQNPRNFSGGAPQWTGGLQGLQGFGNPSYIQSLFQQPPKFY